MGEAVVATLITGFFGILLWSLRRTDDRNTTQHAENKAAVEEVRRDVQSVRAQVEQVQHIQIEGVERGKAALEFAKDTNRRVKEDADKLERHLQWHMDHPKES